MFAPDDDREHCVSQMHRILKRGAFLYLNVPAGPDVPEHSCSLADHRRHQESLCDLRGTVEIGGKEQEVTWPQVASWGLNIYSAAPYFRDHGFALWYIHWGRAKGHGHGLTMYLQRK